MSEGRHTPGPWAVEALKAGNIYVGPEKAAGGSLADVVVVVNCGPEYRPEYNATAEANANLIAAAPELLVALTELLDRYTQLVNCGDCGNWDPETEADVVAARAAIAKAEGQS